MKDKIIEVTNNWDSLPKAQHDDSEFVIIAENDTSEAYSPNMECLGVLKDGTLIWIYYSGCSCGAGGSINKIEEGTIKTFKISKDKTAEEFYNEYKCEPYKADYRGY